MPKKKTWLGRIFLGRDKAGKQRFHWVGRFDTRSERNEAVRQEYQRLEAEGCKCPACVEMGKFQGVAASGLPTIAAQYKRYMKWYRRKNRESSADTTEQRLKPFVAEFGDRALNVPRAELKDWINAEGRWEGCDPVAKGKVWSIVSFFNHAINEDEVPLEGSPARGLGEKSEGRSKEPPPTEEEFQQLLDACSACDYYAPMMRGVFQFASYMLMRPSEIFELKDTDIDLRTMRTRKARRLYRGTVDEPKTGPKLIALTPPAGDAISGLPRPNPPYVFATRTGKRLSQSSLWREWQLVLAASGLDFDFYHATKHYGVWYMWTQLRMSERAIAAQAGWSLKTVMKMLETYGHGDVGALDEVDAAFKDFQAPTLRLVEGGGMQE